MRELRQNILIFRKMHVPSSQETAVVRPAPVLPTAYGINAANSDTASLVIIISVAALLTITCVGFILFKKRKENN